MRTTVKITLGIFIIVALCTALIIIFHLGNAKLTADVPHMQAPAAQKQSQQEAHIANTPMTYEERMGITKNSSEEKVRQYMLNCSEMVSINESLACYEAYFSKNDEAFREGIERCNKSPACLDDFYFDFASKENSVFCNRISDKGYREECISEIK